MHIGQTFLSSYNLQGPTILRMHIVLRITSCIFFFFTLSCLSSKRNRQCLFFCSHLGRIYFIHLKAKLLVICFAIFYVKSKPGLTLLTRKLSSQLYLLLWFETVRDSELVFCSNVEAGRILKAEIHYSGRQEVRAIIIQIASWH